MQGGRFKERLTFQKRRTEADGLGNSEGDWVDQFQLKANVRPRLGGETVIGQRLVGLQPVLITVHKCSMSNEITSGWRAKHAVTGVIYDITSPLADVTGKGKEYEMVAQTGMTQGG